MSAEVDVEGLVREIILALVDEPEQVVVESSQESGITIIEVRVAADDAGKIIGRQGRIIKSIRSLVRAVSTYENGSRIEVEVVG